MCLSIRFKKLEPLKGFGRFALNLKHFQKARRVAILIFHKELGVGNVRGFFYEINTACFKSKIVFYNQQLRLA
ncbi:hypothetical protein C2R59_03990 [Helicobacter pylori]|nr:hypothetical protein C2R59_03990 [Helicobacter pylori]